MTRFSFVIAAYNAAEYISHAIDSVLMTEYPDFEIIIVDDCSRDDTAFVCAEYENSNSNIKLIRKRCNEGPGAARNEGIEAASGDYILFLDSDDMVDKKLPHRLNAILSSDQYDLIEYDFRHTKNGYLWGGRNDLEYFQKDKSYLLKSYLSLWMDGSVIFTAFRRDFLDHYHLKFREGLHEDVDFLFMAFYYAEEIKILPVTGYYKAEVEDSVVNTMSHRHMQGFFQAWTSIRSLIYRNEDLYIKWKEGLVSVFAIFLRRIVLSDTDAEDMFCTLYSFYGRYSNELHFIDKRDFKTKYRYLVTVFLLRMEQKTGWERIKAELTDILHKSWGCYDLYHSLYMGPGEIRACCKRFFVNGKPRGDVVLFSIDSCSDNQNLYEQVVIKKRSLLKKINQGVETECSGCPCLTFSEWNADDLMRLRRLSFEYHSVCNLKCNYCSPRYYGGVLPQYDLKGFIDELYNKGVLGGCEAVVWGGGEPVLEKNFKYLLNRITMLSQIESNTVITNATIYEPLISEMLARGRIRITSSVDAGSSRLYERIRGRNLYLEVMKNLKKYAQANPAAVTVKYILLENNYCLEELQGFVNDICNFSLVDCVFHISCSFKAEHLSEDLITGAVVLYALLKQRGAKIIYFDEFLRERIYDCDTGTIVAYLEEHKLPDIIADPSAYDKVVIWGSENQIRSLLENSVFFQKVKVAGLIAGSPGYIGKRIGNHTLEAPEKLKTYDGYVVIAAVQGTSRIYEEYKEYGFDRTKLIDELIL